MSESTFSMRPLLLEEAEYIYETYMRRDFPQDELKPFGMICAGVQSGNYACFGAFDGEDLVGYAYLVYGPGSEEQRHVLLDYLAVLDNLRGKGYGTKILHYLRNCLTTDGNILIEIEDPDFAVDLEEAEHMRQRQSFYLNAQVHLTDTRTTVYGVHYRILVLPALGRTAATAHTAQQITELYRSLFPDIWWKDGRAEVHTV